MLWVDRKEQGVKLSLWRKFTDEIYYKILKNIQVYPEGRPVFYLQKNVEKIQKKWLTIEKGCVNLI